MNIWSWFHAYRSQAIRNKDTARFRLSNLYFEARSLRDTNVEQAIELLRQGQSLGDQLGEAWLKAFYAHWTLQYLLFFKQDIATAFDLAAQASVEVRKPVYAQLPQRVCLHEDLIHVYGETDPVGYAQEIQTALDYMQAEIAPDMECLYCHHGLRVSFAESLDHWEQAERYATAYLAAADSSGSAHYQANARHAHCTLAHHRQDWSALLEYANECEKFAQQSSRPVLVAETLAWQAVALYHLGRPKEARERHQQAINQASHFDSQPGSGYYSALCAYREAIGELDQAILIRERELKQAIASGSPYRECQCRLKLCRLRAQCGLPIDESLAEARTAAHKLRNPAPFLEKLNQI